jgi:carboxyl-terminal processing protease
VDEDSNVSKNNVRSDKSKTVLLSLIAVVVGVSVFTSGWLFGSGRLSVRSDGLVPTVASQGGEAPTQGLDEIYRTLVRNYDGEVNDEDVLNGLKEGLAKSVDDPFTEYLSIEETTEFNESLNGTFEGIGAELGKEGSFVIIVAPLRGAPAEEAGLRPQDIIVEIDGESAADISITEAVNRIRGPKGETVTLGVIRGNEQLEISIVRDTIKIDSVEWEVQGSTGVITLSRFGNDTTDLIQQAAQELRNQNVTGVVLDMRGNPGGLLDTAVEVSSIWLPKGTTVLEEKRGDEVIQTFKSTQQPLLAGIPTVVLIDQGSASASEIVAGALQDNDAATIYGQQSFGKGSVQQLIPLNGGGSLKVTIARWFTPGGKNIDKEGITPDVPVEISAEDREAERDPQLDAALEALR